MSGTLLALSQRIMHPEMQAMEFFLEAGLRLFMALVFGGMIGWERERHGQPAGLRTHMLICMGAALMMVLSAAISWQFPESQADPGRIAAQVVSGIGFIGGGAILRLRGSIKGITTAASLWVAAGLGLTVGAGMYAVSLLAVVLVVFTLAVITRLEKKVIQPMVLRRLEVVFVNKDNSQDSYLAVEGFNQQLFDFLFTDKLVLREEELDMQFSGQQYQMCYQIKMPRNYDLVRFCNGIRQINGVEEVKVKPPR